MSTFATIAICVLAVMKDPSHLRWVNRILGSAFVAAGVALAAFRRVHAAGS